VALVAQLPIVLAALAPGLRANEITTRLIVRPMATPKPALKYQLLPELRELHAGNAAHEYLKCFMEQRRFFYSKEAVADRARFQAMPLAELPLDQLRNYGRLALRQADWAARSTTIDWQDLAHVEKRVLGQLPPEVGPLQVLAGALHVRFRAEVAERRYGDAIRTAKTMVALARHLGEHPSEVGNLVGLWTAHLALNTLTEMVQQPGCPNLYWALTDLPAPLVEVRKGVQGEGMCVAAQLRGLRDDVALSEAEIDKVVNHFAGVMSFARQQAGKPPRDLRPALQARLKDPTKIHAARRRLVEAGCAEDLVKRLLPRHVVLLDEKHCYENERDERLKLLGLPLWQMDGATRLDGEGWFTHMLPDTITLRRSQGQLEQQIALLRHVEALRLYAAQHDGKLPAKLCEVTVPLPPDPVTGKPFDYRLEGPTAQLRGGRLSKGGKAVGYQVHYEVVCQK
jgi:hypothetical protein